jgi:Ca-activated chloride channel family protein
MRRRTIAATAALSLGALPLSDPGSAAAAEPKPLVLVVDYSGSMWGQIGGEAKVEGARRVIGELGEKLPDGTPLALVAYGHRRDGDCADIEMVLPSAPLDRTALRGAVERLSPKGKTPITAAVKQAFEAAPRGSTVVLVTDGLETCGGDLCAATRTAMAKVGDFVLHVIGFDVAKEDVSSLECAAQAGGGLFLPAADAGELARALDAAVERPADAFAGALVVRATRNGDLQDVAVLVTPKSGGIGLAGRTYAREETNPRTIPLADGTYRVRVRAVGIDGAADLEEEVVIAGGGRIERHYDFSTGSIQIGATRNGALSDVTWQLFSPGDRKRAVATGRTYRAPSHNPARATVPAGAYDLVLTALEIGGKPVWESLGLEIGAGAAVAVAHEFESGELAVEVVRGATLVDAVVAVRSGGKGIDQGRTYKAAASNPIRFQLTPGEYEVEVSEIRGAKRTLNVSVASGEVLRRRIDYEVEE